jgi:hypothetical protein
VAQQPAMQEGENEQTAAVATPGAAALTAPPARSSRRVKRCGRQLRRMVPTEHRKQARDAEMACHFQQAPLLLTWMLMTSPLRTTTARQPRREELPLTHLTRAPPR